MAKRFTATEIWEEDWFLDMPNEYKLFWFYILSKCDHAGLYKVNLRSFRGHLEVKLCSKEAISYFNSGKNRVRIINETLWLIEDFFVYQYGTTFNPNNRVHESIENALTKNNIKMTSIRGLLDLKDRVKDKDKDKDKDILKGGVGENKKLNGIKFDEKIEKVHFADGSFQRLGNEQIILAQNNQITPATIIKGSIY